jgi:hypothetical protein
MSTQLPAPRTNPIEKFLDEGSRRLKVIDKTIDETWFLFFRFKKLRECETQLGRMESLLRKLDEELNDVSDPLRVAYGRQYKARLLAFSEELKEVSRKLALNSGVRDIFKGLPFYAGAVRIVAGTLRVLASILDKLGLKGSSNLLLKAADFVERNLLPQSAAAKQLPSD